MSVTRTEHFSLDEFRCKGNSCCGHDLKITQKLIDTCEAIRVYCGFPITVVSGYRCLKHNIEVGSVIPNSAHTRGLAADLSFSDKPDSNRVLGNLIKKAYGEGKLPYLQYCYLIMKGDRTSVHIGVDYSSKRVHTFAF
jgi:hypothetical protein